MNRKKRLKTANVLKTVSISVLVLIAVFWFVFALLSGAEEYGGGFMGVVKNSPNAIPWLILFGFIYGAYKKELIGGTEGTGSQLRAIVAHCSFLQPDGNEAIVVGVGLGDDSLEPAVDDVIAVHLARSVVGQVGSVVGLE